MKNKVEVIYCNCSQTFVEKENFFEKDDGKLLAKMLSGVSYLCNLYRQQVGILGVGRSVKERVVKDDNSTAIRTMAYFSLSYDHRIIDGALASKFLGGLVEVIENESLLKEVLKI